MRTTRRLLTAILVTAFALSACGSDDPGSSATDAVADASDPGDSAPGDADPTDSAPGDADAGDTESSEPDSDAESGPQGGTVSIDGDVYTFGAEFLCIFNGDSIAMQGPGTGPGSGPFWVDLNIDIPNDDDADGDGEADSRTFISVRGGVTENGQGAPLGEPDFYADNSGFTPGIEIAFELTDDSVSGSGFMRNDVDLDVDEQIPFEFEGSCDDSDDSDDTSDDAATNVTGASGGGIITVAGVAYTFDVEICIFEESGFIVVGPGSDPNGNVGYVSVEGSRETDIDLDGQADESIMVSVEVGAAQMGSGTEDQPYFTVSAWGDALAEQITFERTDNSVSGSGTMTDDNAVAAEFGEPIPFEFEARCA